MFYQIRHECRGKSYIKFGEENWKSVLVTTKKN